MQCSQHTPDETPIERAIHAAYVYLKGTDASDPEYAAREAAYAARGAIEGNMQDVDNARVHALHYWLCTREQFAAALAEAEKHLQ